MPRGRRRLTDVEALERELNELKQRQAELRQRLRSLRGSRGEVRKLEDRLAKQFATAKWIAEQIKRFRPEFDELEFYRSVEPRQPAPRGRRRRATAEAAEAAPGA